MSDRPRSRALGLDEVRHGDRVPSCNIVEPHRHRVFGIFRLGSMAIREAPEYDERPAPLWGDAPSRSAACDAISALEKGGNGSKTLGGVQGSGAIALVEDNAERRCGECH